MNSDNLVCPHCGYRSEDDELCVACGKLFHEDDHVVGSVSFFELMKSGLRSLFKESNKDLYETDKVTLDQDSDLDVDPSWSILSTNIYHNRRR